MRAWGVFGALVLVYGVARAADVTDALQPEELTESFGVPLVTDKGCYVGACNESCCPPPEKVIATVLTTDDHYVTTATVLGQSLLASGNLDNVTRMVALVGLENGDKLNMESGQLLKAAGWDLVYVKQMKTPWPKEKCNSFCDTYTKLRLWEMFPAPKIAIFMDADIMVQPQPDRSIAQLLESHMGLADNAIVAADEQGNMNTINSGVFVFRPSLAVRAEMQRAVGKIEQLAVEAKDRNSTDHWHPAAYSDQSFLHAFFQPCLTTEECDRSRRITLDPEYNCLAAAIFLHQGLAGKLNLTLDSCANVHFTWFTKPWIKGKWVEPMKATYDQFNKYRTEVAAAALSTLTAVEREDEVSFIETGKVGVNEERTVDPGMIKMVPSNDGGYANHNGASLQPATNMHPANVNVDELLKSHTLYQETQFAKMVENPTIPVERSLSEAVTDTLHITSPPPPVLSTPLQLALMQHAAEQNAATEQLSPIAPRTTFESITDMLYLTSPPAPIMAPVPLAVPVRIGGKPAWQPPTTVESVAAKAAAMKREQMKQLGLQGGLGGPDSPSSVISNVKLSVGDWYHLPSGAFDITEAEFKALPPQEQTQFVAVKTQNDAYQAIADSMSAHVNPDHVWTPPQQPEPRSTLQGISDTLHITTPPVVLAQSPVDTTNQPSMFSKYVTQPLSYVRRATITGPSSLVKQPSAVGKTQLMQAAGAKEERTHSRWFTDALHITTPQNVVDNSVRLDQASAKRERTYSRWLSDSLHMTTPELYLTTPQSDVDLVKQPSAVGKTQLMQAAGAKAEQTYSRWFTDALHITTPKDVVDNSVRLDQASAKH